MWLLDANIDVHLIGLLKEHGINAETAAMRGWKAFDNGTLVSAAVSAGFTALITKDQLFAESAAKALKKFPEFAVVVVHLPQRPWAQYKKDFFLAWSQCRITPLSGKIIHWP
jgi:hypothetical protein